jgi:hypothetical protein
MAQEGPINPLKYGGSRPKYVERAPAFNPRERSRWFKRNAHYIGMSTDRSYNMKGRETKRRVPEYRYTSQYIPSRLAKAATPQYMASITPLVQHQISRASSELSRRGKL